jgi:hypothetical protein
MSKNTKEVILGNNFRTLHRFFLIIYIVNNIKIITHASNPDVFLFLQAILQFRWAALTACVDVADEVVFIVDGSEVVPVQAQCFLFYVGLLGIFPMLAAE